MPQPDHIVFDWDPKAPPAELAGGVRVPSEFSAQLYYRRLGGMARVDIACAGGRSRIVALNMAEAPGRGLTGVSIAQVSVQRVLDNAVERMAMYYALHAGEGPPVGGLDAARAASRKRVSDERLEGVLLAADQGGVEQVMSEEGVGERQAFRLIKRAKEAGGAS